MKVIKEKYTQYDNYYNAYVEKIADAIERALQEDKYSYSDFCYNHDPSQGFNKQLVDDYVKDMIREFNDGYDVLTFDEWNNLYDMAEANDVLDKYRLEGGHDAFWNDFDLDVSDRIVDFVKSMNESLEEDTDNEFLTKQDVDATRWLIKHGKNASVGQIKRAQDVIKQYKNQIADLTNNKNKSLEEGKSQKVDSYGIDKIEQALEFLEKVDIDAINVGWDFFSSTHNDSADFSRLEQLKKYLDTKLSFYDVQRVLFKDNNKNTFYLTLDLTKKSQRNMNPHWETMRITIHTRKQDESLEEDTVKTSDGKWTNKGKEGTHGKFKTKKQADSQRKAMFANGYKESLSENFRSAHTDELESKSVTDLKPGDIVYITNGMYDWCIGKVLDNAKAHYDRRGNVEEYEYRVKVLVPLTDHLKQGSVTNGFSRGSVSIFTGDVDSLEVNENLTVEDTKSMNEKLNKDQISAFKDIIGFNADMEEDLEEDLDVADYDSVYSEVALEKLVEKIENDFKNEPFEESEDELTERLANEFAAKQYKRAYDCYCGQVKTRYGSLDERNLPIDEKLIDYASCKCNYDANVLKERLIQGMRDLNDQ